MKLKITKQGVFWQGKKELPVGKVIEVKGDVVPAALVNKAEVVSQPEAEDKVFVAAEKASK